MLDRDTIKYYMPELEIDGTIDEMVRQIRNGYIDDVEHIPTMEKVAEILREQWKDDHSARYVEANINYVKLRSEIEKIEAKGDLTDEDRGKIAELTLEKNFYIMLSEIEEHKAKPNSYDINMEETEFTRNLYDDEGTMYSCYNASYDKNEDFILITMYVLTSYNNGEAYEQNNGDRYSYDYFKDWKPEDVRRATDEIYAYSHAEEVQQDEQEREDV